MNRINTVQEFIQADGLAPLEIDPFTPSPCAMTDVLEEMGCGVRRRFSIEWRKVYCPEHQRFGIATAILVLVAAGEIVPKNRH